MADTVSGKTAVLTTAAAIQPARGRFKAHRGRSQSRYWTENTLLPTTRSVTLHNAAASSVSRPEPCAHHVAASPARAATVITADTGPTSGPTAFTLRKLKT